MAEKANTSDEKPFDISDAPKAPMPTGIEPMLATLVERPFDRAGWLFEVKWDGFRAIAEIDNRGVRLYSRRHLSYADRFPRLTQALGKLQHEAVLDGEIVVLDQQGRPQFQLLQRYQKTGSGRLVYCVFDLLYLDGRDLRGLPLRRRKEILKQLIGNEPELMFSEHIEDSGVAFFRAAAEQGLEGMVAKNGKSAYRGGSRSQQWLKTKIHARQEAIICGFTRGQGARQKLGALVLGVYETEKLVYVGHVGTGFTDKCLADLYARLEPLQQDRCPFCTRPKTNAPVQWVRPELVCEVRFREWSADGHLRIPIFEALREDKDPHSVRREVPTNPDQILTE